MQRYHNVAGDSGVVAYETRPDGILVRFKSGDVYLYTHASAGRKNIVHMKRLAKTGQGLSTFISQHVAERYAAKLP